MPPTVELEARLDEILASLDFVAAASVLRPRLGPLLNRQVGAAALNPATDFIRMGAGNTEVIFGSLLIRAIGAFERFVRLLIDDAIARHTTTAKSVHALPPAVVGRNVALTGRALASFESPRTYPEFDYSSLATNLASCMAGHVPYALNSPVFSAAVVSGTPETIGRALANVGIRDWWDAMGRDPDLQGLLGHKGKVRATADAAHQRLDELCRLRNHIAHAGDLNIVVTEQMLRDSISFLRLLGTALQAEAVKQVE